MIPGMRAFLFLVSYSFKRQLRSRKMLLSALLLVALVVVVFLAGLQKSWTPRSFCEVVVLKMLGLFFLPVVALVFGTGAIGDDLEEKSLVYLIIRPLARASVFFGKLIAVVPLALLFTLGGLWLLHEVALFSSPRLLHLGQAAEVAPSPGGSLGMYWPAILLGSLAYLAFFHFLAAAFRHSTIIAISYVFFVEVFLGLVPGIVKRGSISFYTSSMVYHAVRPLGIDRPHGSLLPLEGGVAGSILLGIACGFLLIGAWCFARKEYHENA